MIGFAGLSHLGIIYSLATAAKGFDVVCYDASQDLVSTITAGRFPVEEPGLPELFAAHRSQLRYTADAKELAACDLVFASLDIKTDDTNRSDTGPLTALLQTVVPVLKRGTTLVILSQVNPGFTREFAAQIEANALNVYYQVETLVFGRAVERAMHPERYMVGAQDPAQPAPPVFRAWHERFDCPVLLMGYESAELAKIAINLFLVSTVSTTNTLAELCARIGAQWDEIAPALRLDARIGPRAYLTPGLGISGGNLERDLMTIKRLADGSDVDTGIVDAWIDNSRHVKAWPTRTLRETLAARGLDAASVTLAIWGLAYKENTHSTKNSPSLAFIAAHPTCRKAAYDPVVRVDAATFPAFAQRATALECCRDADVLLILTPWPEFKSASLTDLRAAMRGDVIIDPFGMLNQRGAETLGFEYHRLGAPAQLRENATV